MTVAGNSLGLSRRLGRRVPPALIIPVMAVVSVVPFVHAAYAAYRAGKGEEYRYPVAADLTDGR